MSHHMATPEPQINITDLYVFQKPGDASKYRSGVQNNPPGFSVFFLRLRR